MSDQQPHRRVFAPDSAGVIGQSREEAILLAHKAELSSAGATAPPAAGPMPTGVIGNVEISRLICGGNLLGGYAHSRKEIYVSSLLTTYFTEQKIFDTLQRCEENGINTIVTHLATSPNDARLVDCICRYKERGGGIQWIAQCAPFSENIEELVQSAVDGGCIGAFLMGVLGDRWTRNQRVDLIHQAVEQIQQHGLIAGVAGHDLEVPVECEKQNVNPDFYVKTLHRNDNHDTMWCISAEETAAFMQTVQKPWIAYKVMAAGGIAPAEGFSFAFEQGADFVLAGMFDFHVVENALITKHVMTNTRNRTRPWMA
jgi:hypothetical protein